MPSTCMTECLFWAGDHLRIILFSALTTECVGNSTSSWPPERPREGLACLRSQPVDEGVSKAGAPRPTSRCTMLAPGSRPLLPWHRFPAACWLKALCPVLSNSGPLLSGNKQLMGRHPSLEGRNYTARRKAAPQDYAVFTGTFFSYGFCY